MSGAKCTPAAPGQGQLDTRAIEIAVEARVKADGVREQLSALHVDLTGLRNEINVNARARDEKTSSQFGVLHKRIERLLWWIMTVAVSACGTVIAATAFLYFKLTAG